MNFQTPNINDTMVELMKTLEGLKMNKEMIDKDIEKGELLKEQLIETINACEAELDKINESLEQKTNILSVYEKILTDSDSAYSQIVKSTEALYQMVKSEEKKVGNKIYK